MRVTYTEWSPEEKEISRPQGNKEAVSFKVTIKKQIESSLEELIDHFNLLLHKFKKHAFNIRQQFSFSRELKRTLSSQECIVHVDFSENYVCKMSREIQAVHFSHQQATMHTDRISESKSKGPPAIWQHFEHVFDYIRANYPSVSVVHFFSDGPCMQYRQKGNLFLFSTELYRRGFKSGTWNFFEASHGKGAPDGVGGVLKRLADQLVCQGHDIPDPATLYRALLTTGTTVKLFYVEAERVEEAHSLMPENITSVPGTMRIHQVVTNEKGHLITRDVSCMCVTQKNVSCKCFNARQFIFPTLSRGCQIIEAEQPGPSNNPANVNPQLTISERPLREPHKGHQEIDWSQNDMIGSWCVVTYDKELYPGIILAKDEANVQVKCMHHAGQGKNRFYWPPLKDEIWYLLDDIVRLIPAPENVTLRHVEIQKDIWAELTK
ncbi:hypothetical protein N1851_032633 [Merluccius polli]|uniref:Uncharacterized protein n=1 Tax=Merluccius polli TaxID=89951 RepID=A0AA47NNK1_MERPO|nr:hypothetical protein N1851_032633 [Merluccius polli]